jgi:hypothetical protein
MPFNDLKINAVKLRHPRSDVCTDLWLADIGGCERDRIEVLFNATIGESAINTWTKLVS